VGKWRLRWDLAAAKLTTTIEDIQKVEFLVNFLVCRWPVYSDRKESGDQKHERR
jgi:hypothetical protein